MTRDHTRSALRTPSPEPLKTGILGPSRGSRSGVVIFAGQAVRRASARARPVAGGLDDALAGRGRLVLITGEPGTARPAWATRSPPGVPARAACRCLGTLAGGGRRPGLLALAGGAGGAGGQARRRGAGRGPGGRRLAGWPSSSPTLRSRLSAARRRRSPPTRRASSSGARRPGLVRRAARPPGWCWCSTISRRRRRRWRCCTSWRASCARCARCWWGTTATSRPA